MNTNCFYNKFPIIDQNNGFSLREIHLSDAPNYHRYMNHPLMKSVLCRDHIPQNVDLAIEELSYWRSLFPLKRSIYWAIANENNELIGTAGFNNIAFKNCRAEISYDLAPEYWGKGVMSEAINSIIEFGKEELELVRIQATVTVSNTRSIKLLDKCGFKQEGRLEKYEIIEGKHCDYFMYSILVG